MAQLMESCWHKDSLKFDKTSCTFCTWATFLLSRCESEGGLPRWLGSALCWGALESLTESWSCTHSDPLFEGELLGGQEGLRTSHSLGSAVMKPGSSICVLILLCCHCTAKKVVFLWKTREAPYTPLLALAILSRKRASSEVLGQIPMSEKETGGELS